MELGLDGDVTQHNMRCVESLTPVISYCENLWLIVRRCSYRLWLVTDGCCSVVHWHAEQLNGSPPILHVTCEVVEFFFLKNAPELQLLNAVTVRTH